MDPDPRLATARWLADPSSAPARDAARAVLAAHPGDPLAAAAGLRRRMPALAAEQSSAVLEQAELARLAGERYDLDSAGLLLTRDGLEQATRPEVADHRARLLAASGVRRVLDLTAGLGFDTAAFLRAGLDVIAVERDPVTAVLLAHNQPAARVVIADATHATLPHAALADLVDGLAATDVVFVDPARRDPSGARGAGLRARPERDPERWSPPWSFIEAIDHPRVAAKVAPSFAPPAGWHAEWTSVRRRVVECAVYSWPVNGAPTRALVWADGHVHAIDGDLHAIDRGAGPATAAAALGPALLEPDPAVLRAGAVATLAGHHAGLSSLDEESTWLTGPAVDSPFVRSYPVVAELGGSTTAQRRQLDSLGVTALTMKCRDVDIAPAVVLRELRRSEGPAHVLVVTRLGGRTVRVLCRPALPR